MPSSWWSCATTEQKLAQVEGAIEVGMTSAQCSMNVGTGSRNVSLFAQKHGLTFSGVGHVEAARHRRASAAAIRKYLSGEDVDFWRSA